jgi:hypothetical protein
MKDNRFPTVYACLVVMMCDACWCEVFFVPNISMFESHVSHLAS